MKLMKKKGIDTLVLHVLALVKPIGGVKGLFFILFNLVLTKLQDAFYRF